MNGLQTDSNGIETLALPATGEGGEGINENFATISALISTANALIAELQAAVAALTTAQAAHAVLAGPSSGSPAVPAFRALTAGDIPTLNQNTTGTAANVTGTVALANGGTGQTAQQAAIDALTNVSSATNGYVLTKDTSTGHALFKAASGGGSPGGTNGELQFNSSGAFGGDTATTDGSGNLAVTSLTTTGNLVVGSTSTDQQFLLNFNESSPTQNNVIFRNYGSGTEQVRLQMSIASDSGFALNNGYVMYCDSGACGLLDLESRLLQLASGNAEILINSPTGAISITYLPGNSGNWQTPAPSDLPTAMDRVAAALTTLGQMP